MCQPTAEARCGYQTQGNGTSQVSCRKMRKYVPYWELLDKRVAKRPKRPYSSLGTYKWSNKRIVAHESTP